MDIYLAGPKIAALPCHGRGRAFAVSMSTAYEGLGQYWPVEPWSPETVRKQISEADECLPARGSAGQPSIETRIEDERFPSRIAHCPKIPNGMAAQQRLRKVPNFTRKQELSDDRM